MKWALMERTQEGVSCVNKPYVVTSQHARIVFNSLRALLDYNNINKKDLIKSVTKQKFKIQTVQGNKIISEREELKEPYQAHLQYKIKNSKKEIWKI